MAESIYNKSKFDKNVSDIKIKDNYINQWFCFVIS